MLVELSLALGKSNHQTPHRLELKLDDFGSWLDFAREKDNLNGVLYELDFEFLGLNAIKELRQTEGRGFSHFIVHHIDKALGEFADVFLKQTLRKT